MGTFFGRHKRNCIKGPKNVPSFGDALWPRFRVRLRMQLRRFSWLNVTRVMGGQGAIVWNCGDPMQMCGAVGSPGAAAPPTARYFWLNYHTDAVKINMGSKGIAKRI